MSVDFHHPHRVGHDHRTHDRFAILARQYHFQFRHHEISLGSSTNCFFLSQNISYCQQGHCHDQ
ncbi:MAG: hypothetical protein IT422_26250 [Pirellulaceae bacterium]|nr:hypothetical protein [Pirellulaceae bacterium]